MEDGLERMSMYGSFFRKQEDEIAEKKALPDKKKNYHNYQQLKKRNHPRI